MRQATRKIIIAHYRPDIVSGAENSIADFVDKASPRFQITMLVPGEGNLAQYYRRQGFDVWVNNIQTPRRARPGLHLIQSFIMARELKRREVDAVICNTVPAAGRVMTATSRAGLPMGIYLRDYTPDTLLYRRILGQASALLAISHDVIQHHSPMAALERFHLAYNYINPEPILARRAAHLASGKRLLPFGAEHPVIGLVGRITPYKQPDLFIRAIPHILNHVPDARFVLVGKAQERERHYENRIKSLAEELGVANKVLFLGHRPDAVEITSEFTIACLASGREPLGRVVLEAHLLEVPVVVPDSGGPAEIVQSGETGLCFSSQAPDAAQRMAEEILRLLKDEGLRKCLAVKGREHVIATFASQKHVEIQDDLIDQLCDKRPEY